MKKFFKLTKHKMLATILFCFVIFLVMAAAMDLSGGVLSQVLNFLGLIVLFGAEGVGNLLSHFFPGIGSELSSGGSLNFIILVAELLWIYILVCLGFWIVNKIRQ